MHYQNNERFILMTIKIICALLCIFSLHGAELNLKKRSAEELDRVENPQAKRDNKFYFQSLKAAVEGQDYASCIAALTKLNDPSASYFLSVTHWDGTVINSLKSLPEYKAYIEPFLAKQFCDLLYVYFTVLTEEDKPDYYEETLEQFMQLLVDCAPDIYNDPRILDFLIKNDDEEMFENVTAALNLSYEKLITLTIPLYNQLIVDASFKSSKIIDTFAERNWSFFSRELAHRGSLAFMIFYLNHLTEDSDEELSIEHNSRELLERVCQFEDVTEEDSALKLSRICAIIDKYNTRCCPLSGLCFLKNTKKQTGAEELEPLISIRDSEIIQYLIQSALSNSQPAYYYENLLPFLPQPLDHDIAYFLLYNSLNNNRHIPFVLLQYLIAQLSVQQLKQDSEVRKREIFSARLVYYIQAHYPQSALLSIALSIIEQYSNSTKVRYDALIIAINLLHLTAVKQLLSPDLYLMKDDHDNTLFHILAESKEQNDTLEQEKALEIVQYFLQTLPEHISITLLTSLNKDQSTPLQKHGALPIILALLNRLREEPNSQLSSLSPSDTTPQTAVCLNHAPFADFDILISKFVQANSQLTQTRAFDPFKIEIMGHMGTFSSWMALRHSQPLPSSCTIIRMGNMRTTLVNKMLWCRSNVTTNATMVDFTPVGQLIKNPVHKVAIPLFFPNIQEQKASLIVFYASCKAFVRNIIMRGTYSELSLMQNIKKADHALFDAYSAFLSLFFTYKEIGDLLYAKRQEQNCYQLIQIVSKEYDLTKLTYGENFSPLLPVLFESNNSLLVAYLANTVEFRTQKDIDALTGIASQKGSFKQLFDIALYPKLTVPSLLCARKMITQKEHDRMNYINFDNESDQ